MHESRKIANRFLELAVARGDTITPMQLIKLVYIAHGWMLGLYGRPLICDEIQAWQYGPVIPKLYNAVRKFRSGPVTGPLQTSSGSPLSAEEDDVVRQTYEIYGDLSGPALSRLTHAKDTPWALTYIPESFGLVISDDLIQDHYAMLAARG